MNVSETLPTVRDLIERLRVPEFRAAATEAGRQPGQPIDVPKFAERLAEVGYHLTPASALAARRQGWNLCCNRCGTYGASWLPGERPGRGDLALCPTHASELALERERHERALAGLRTVRFEQPPPIGAINVCASVDPDGTFHGRDY